MSDWFAHRFPVSVKGIVCIDGRIVLLKNERGEWDLPGGKLGRNEELEAALEREMEEELGIVVQVEALLHAFRAAIQQQINVLIVVYHCTTNARAEELRLSGESFAIGLFRPEELESLPLAQPIYASIIARTVEQHTPENTFTKQ